MASSAGGDDRERELKERLIKAARMYAMCEKAGVPEPMDVSGLAVAAFEDLPLREALVFVRTNEQNVRDLAWAFANSGSAEEFEQRLGEIKTLPEPGGPRR
ncbi:MAG TPA: hypothetical protein VN178_07375 [Rubrobacter sp.]|jgi:hypothetical protein|nr:hypothetical protein [Rubrobacter sp.]